jgi:acyl carrier protein
MPSGQRRQALITYLGDRALQVLGLDASTPLNPKAALKDIGLDSLMAVELRNALAKSLVQALPATLLFDYPTLEALAVHLLRMLGLEAGAEAKVPEADAAALAEISELSDEEAEVLLLKEFESGPWEHT